VNFLRPNWQSSELSVIKIGVNLWLSWVYTFGDCNGLNGA